jgi:hypothetical protein
MLNKDPAYSYTDRWVHIRCGALQHLLFVKGRVVHVVHVSAMCSVKQWYRMFRRCGSAYPIS